MEAEGNKISGVINGPMARPAMLAAKVLAAESLNSKDSSGSRSDSRDSGLGKDSESDGGKDTTAPVADMSGGRITKSDSPNSTGSRPGSGLEASTDIADRLQGQSPPHSRPRSRSPCDRGGPDAKSTPDKYCNYDKHFKKKFFGKELRKTINNPKIEKACSPEVRHAKFRPKGKDWEKNQSRANSRSTGPDSSEPAPASSAGTRGKGLSASSTTPTSSPNSSTISSGDSISSTSNNTIMASQPHDQASNTTHSGSKHTSAFRMTCSDRTSGGKSRPSSAEAAAPTGKTLTSPASSRPPSLGPPITVASSLVSHPNIRTTAEQAHAGLAQLARVPVPVRPFSQTMMDRQSSVNAHLANVMPPNSGHLAGSHRFGVPRMDFETSRMLYAELAPRPFGVSFGGPPTFQSPMGDMAGPRPNIFPELGLPRSMPLPNGGPAFRAETFKPLTHKEKAWKTMNSRK